MNSALSGTDPVVVLESQRIYDMGERFHEGGVPKEYYEIPIGLPDVKRAGSDITILTVGAKMCIRDRAVDTPRGLMVPTIANAETLSLNDLASISKSMANACKEGSISPDALKNGSCLLYTSKRWVVSLQFFSKSPNWRNCRQSKSRKRNLPWHCTKIDFPFICSQK